MKTLLLIDSNSLLHRAFHALPPLTTPNNEPIGAVYGLTSIILKIFREQKPDYMAAAFDRPEPTFRDVIFKEYKIHRPPTADTLIPQIKKSQELFEKFGIKICEAPGFEADDIIGSLVEKFRDQPDLKIVILSGDLDALQLVENDKIVAQFLKTGISDTFIYNESAVCEKYGLRPSQLPDYKGLVGDASDNIPGVKGVGPKSAIPLLQEYKNIENLLEDIGIVPGPAAKKIEEQKEQALLSKKLATIKRDISFPFGLEDLKLPPLNEGGLKEYFKELGFESLIKRLEDNTRI